MRQAIRLLSVIFILVKLSDAIPITLTLYNSANFSGQNVKLGQTRTSAACVNTLIGTVNSQCSSGFWIYSSSGSAHFTIGLNENTRCSQFASNDLAVFSVRRLGPEDTTHPAIVFYSGSGTTNYQINEKLANANITVPLTSASHVILTYGSSNWTLFELPNFEGKSACLQTPDVVRLSKLYEVHSNMTAVGSVIKGCDFSRSHIEEVKMKLRLSDLK